MIETRLYFIAVIPPRELRNKVSELKRDMAKRFGSARALKVMPHITLKAPFQLPVAAHDGLFNWFNGIKVPESCFTILLDGFGAFNNKKSPVIFIKPVASVSLVLLQRELIHNFQAVAPTVIHPVDIKFTPHMTIAYRDLTPGNFEKAWSEYSDKEFKEEFEINAVHLLRHDGKQWNIIASHPLAKG